MRFWVREIAGWALLVAGLWVFLGCLDLLDRGRPIEAGAQTAIGFILFRGGIHLLKVAVAARVCLQAQRRIEEPWPVPTAPLAARRMAAPPGRT
jgi:hypothetical protein